MVATLAIAVLVLYLLLGEPLLGRLSHRRMLAALDRGDQGARLRFYLHWIWQGWLLMLVVLGITLGPAGWTFDRLGLRWPDWPHAPDIGHGALLGFVVGAAIAMIGGALVAAFTRNRPLNRRSRIAAADRNAMLAPMLPHTRAERLGWAGLSITAGVTEEVIWRGFGLTLLLALLPDAHPALPIALAALAFGWAHFYQGATGVLATAAFGGALALLFWVSGSLLLPMLVHILLDLPHALTRAPTTAGGEA